MIPAVVEHDRAVGEVRVAALSVLERLVVALHRGGCGPITIVSEGPLPRLARAERLGIDVRRTAAVPPIHGATLLARSSLLTTADEVRRVVAAGGRLAGDDGEGLPLGFATSWRGDVERSIRDSPRVLARAGTVAIDAPADAPAARRRFWASLKSSTDSMMDRWVNRPLGRPLSKLLVHTPVTPNQVTIFQLLVGFAAAVLFARGGYTNAVVAAIVFQISVILDCVDGDLAHAGFKETSIGKWLDIGGDNLVHVAVFVGIATGLERSGSDAPLGILAASTVVGTAIAFAVVVRGMLKPEVRRNPRLAALIDTMSNRDFSYAVLAMAIFDVLELFMWCAAVGVHVFWIAAVAVQMHGAWSPAQAETEDAR